MVPIYFSQSRTSRASRAMTIFKRAVNEIATQELKVTTLALMKKVAMTATTAVIGFSYLQSATGPDGKPLFVRDIGDFLNWCVKFTLKFGLEFAILSGKPTIADIMKGSGE